MQIMFGQLHDIPHHDRFHREKALTVLDARLIPEGSGHGRKVLDIILGFLRVQELRLMG